MIQRIQSVFLLVASAFQAWLLTAAFYTGKVKEYDVTYTAWQSINTGSGETHFHLLHIILQFGLIGVTLFTIFKFNNRKQQMKLCLYLVLGTILSFVFSVYTLFTTNFSEYHFGFGTYLISILLIVYVSAYFFIKKDDDLVKSTDRLLE